MSCQWAKNSRDAVWLWQLPSEASDFDTSKTHRLSLQALVRRIGPHPTPDQKRDIALKCSGLQDKVVAFQKQAESMYHTVSSDADDTWGDENTREEYTSTKFDGISEDNNDMQDLAAKKYHQMQFVRDNPANGCIDAERISLHLLSHIGRGWCNRNAAKDLAKVELHLWEGQLNDSLHHICIALGHKSYLFRNNVLPACTQRLKTHAWAEVHGVESTV